MSLPLRECGLKSKAKGGKPKDKNVTPFAGVWIETDLTADEFTRLMSLPLWECGLKPEIYGTIERKSGHSLCGSVD